MSVIGRRHFLFASSPATIWWQGPCQFNKDHQQQGAAKDRGHSQLLSHAGQAICLQHARHGKNAILIPVLTREKFRLMQFNELPIPSRYWMIIINWKNRFRIRRRPSLESCTLAFDYSIYHVYGNIISEYCNIIVSSQLCNNNVIIIM